VEVDYYNYAIETSQNSSKALEKTGRFVQSETLFAASYPAHHVTFSLSMSTRDEKLNY